MLYYASEPSDYEFEDKTYQDVHQLALEYADYDPDITTREEDDDWLKFIDQRQGYNRISTDEKNKEEIESFKNNYSNIRVTEDQGNKHIPGIGLTF